MKKSQLLVDIGVGLATVSLVTFGIWSLAQKDPENPNECAKIGQNHQLTVQSDAFSAKQLILNRCDTVTITNTGGEAYRLAFGSHEDLIEYPGFSMQNLRQNEYFVITARAAGTYQLHDHLRAKAHITLDIRELPQ
jgi:hypothetical protein